MSDEDDDAEKAQVEDEKIRYLSNLQFIKSMVATRSTSVEPSPATSFVPGTDGYSLSTPQCEVTTRLEKISSLVTAVSLGPVCPGYGVARNNNVDATEAASLGLSSAAPAVLDVKQTLEFRLTPKEANCIRPSVYHAAYVL